MKTIMKTPSKTKDMAYYLSLPYVVEIAPIPEDEGGGYVACIPLLGRYSAVGDGETPEEAYADLMEARSTLIEEWLRRGIAIPEPQTAEEEALPSGKLSLRLPRSLHAQVNRQADQEGVSINAYITAGLAQAVAGNTFGHQINRLEQALERVATLASPTPQWTEKANVSYTYNNSFSTTKPARPGMPVGEGHTRAS